MGAEPGRGGRPPLPNLTPAAARVYAVVEAGGPIGARELAKAAHLRRDRLAEVLGYLVDVGLVEAEEGVPTRYRLADDDAE